MRIIAEFDIDGIKVSVFKMDDRISAKYEYNLLEQTYKFRDGSGINTPDDVLKLSHHIIEDLKITFTNMAKFRFQGIQAMQQEEDDMFDQIV